MDPEDRVGHHVKRVEQELMAIKNAAVKPSGLTVPQYAALFYLADNPGMSAAALARACLVTPQSMATVLTNLEAKGLVERSQHPWHKNVLETRLTEAGAKALEIADRAATTIERRMSAAFSDDERAQLIALLHRVSENLHSQAAEIGSGDGKKSLSPFHND
jgi:DNA-binding MarR family transcriptional regulator